MGDEQNRTSRTTAWLRRQAQLQADGTYLIRPFRLIPIIYQVDEDTKERWIRFQRGFGWVALLWIVAFFVFVKGRDWAEGWGFTVWAIVLLAVGYGGAWLVVRQSPRVSRRRWVGPAVVDAAGRYPRSRYLVLGLLALLMALVFTNWWIAHRAEAENPTDGILPLVIWWGLTGAMAYRYFQSRGNRGPQ